MNRKIKVYIAGPMRGIPEFNFPAFDKAAAFGRSLGYEIISPAELDRDHGFNEKGCSAKVNEQGHNAVVNLNFMRGAAWRDFLAIVGPNPETPGVDAVALLPGWENSKGANGELALAKWIGLEVLDATTFKPYDFAPKPIQNGEFVLKDNGDRTKFATGAVRDASANKGFFHCLPFIAIERLAKLYEAGARKYGKDNWKKGIPLSRYVDAYFRHGFKLSEGWIDEDHAAALMWNAVGFMWTLNEIEMGLLPAELNDIDFPVKDRKGEASAVH